MLHKLKNKSDFKPARASLHAARFVDQCSNPISGESTFSFIILCLECGAWEAGDGPETSRQKAAAAAAAAVAADNGGGGASSADGQSQQHCSANASYSNALILQSSLH